MSRVAYYGGSFDPVHCGHISVASSLLELFDLDRFVFLPAFHAPHKIGSKPASAYHRFAMLTLATADEPRMSVSTLELDHAQKRFTVDSLPEILRDHPTSTIFFVMGADSWKEICTWKRWEDLLLMTNHIVVTRPGYEIGFDHVTKTIRDRIVDLRGLSDGSGVRNDGGMKIYVTDAVKLDVSATEIRNDVREDDRLDREDDVPEEVANYIEKYELYK